MAFLKKMNSATSSEMNTGFGVNSSDYGGRFVNKNGVANTEKKGLNFFEKISWYHTMLLLSRWKFLAVIVSFYVLINLFFGTIYFLIGGDRLGGMVYHSMLQKFEETFFFSCQTFTTVGYGRINPVGFLASAVSSAEALLGLLTFALATGLFYGRFSRPQSFIKFSENVIIAPYKNINALMFRLTPYKNNALVEAEAKITLGIAMEEDGKKVNKFFSLPLEFASVNSLNLSWTVVHPINEESPLYHFTEKDFKTIRGEILVFIKAFDDMFCNTVIAKTSYIFQEVVVGAKFNPMYKRSDNGDKTIIYLDKLNSYAKADISFAAREEKSEEEIITAS